MAFSPDGRLLISGAGERYYDSRITHDAELILWDATLGRPIRRFAGLKGAAQDVAFSPDGKLIAVGSGYHASDNISDGHLSVWDAASGGLVFDRLEAGNNVLSVAFSPDGRLSRRDMGNTARTTQARPSYGTRRPARKSTRSRRLPAVSIAWPLAPTASGLPWPARALWSSGR